MVQHDGEAAREKSKKQTTMFVLGGLGLGLVACLCCGAGGGVGGWWMYRDSTSAKIVGTWKAQFEAGVRGDVAYTFREDGSFREERFAGGAKFAAQEGKWRVANNRIEIDWNNGRWERATVTWKDKNTFIYEVNNHSELDQIGTKTTFTRQ
jgi:hypothetical protein